MTLSEMLGSTRRALDKDADATLIRQYINDAMMDLAHDLRPTRTDCIRMNRWKLTRVPVEILRVARGRDTAAVTYVYVPRLLERGWDEPDLPAWCHGALVAWAVQRYRQSGVGA